jgi:crotonobetainyl-CoA:carnitine CoA-transferase CaiB-like acyl-CoA transferase
VASIERVNSAGRPGPLAGLKVLELSTVLAGPYCSMVLADLGADVIKVEPPEGDATRGYGPPWVVANDGSADRVAAYFLAVNRNKRSISVDLRQQEGVDIVRRLIGRSDVLVENFRPGRMAKLGLDDDALATLNPKLIHLAISGYGPDGPDSAKPGYDFIAQAVGGLMSVTGYAAESGGDTGGAGGAGGATKVGVAISDVVTGLLGAIGILAALHSGVGQRIDVSLLEATLASLINQAQNAFVTGEQPTRRGNAHPNIVPYETFQTADMEIAVAVGSERQWPRLCHALGLDHLINDARFADNDARVQNRDELRPLIANRFLSEPAAHWLAALDAADVPSGAVNDILQAFAQAQAQHRGMEQMVDHPRLGPIRQIGLPYKLSATPASIRSAPPLLGEQSTEILNELGYDTVSIDELRERGVI